MSPGKGVDAAVATGLTRYVLRSAAVSDDDPIQVLHNLNSVLEQRLGSGRNRLCTLIYGNVTRRGDGFDVELASGGHPPPLLLGGDGSAYYADTIGGHAVGMTDSPHFVANRLHLAPGDTLVLYTDGLTEARTGSGTERFDDEGALLRFAKDAGSRERRMRRSTPFVSCSTTSGRGWKTMPQSSRWECPGRGRVFRRRGWRGERYRLNC